MRLDVTSCRLGCAAGDGAGDASVSAVACVSVGRAVRRPPMPAARRAGTISVDRYGMSGMSAWANAGDAVESDSLPDLLGRESHSLNSGAGAEDTAGVGEVDGAVGASEVVGASGAGGDGGAEGVGVVVGGGGGRGG